MVKENSILIVDDTPVNIKILGSLLKDDFNITVANSADSARRVLNGSELPDLILLDILMPGENGYEFCEFLKGNEQTKDIPVIFITAKDTKEDELRGFKVGAVDYITKPFTEPIVKARVNTHIRLKKLQDLLSDYAYLDSLTMLPNRRKAMDFIQLHWNLSQSSSYPISAVMIDVDHFKLYNDHYGHPKGDSCLANVGRVLSKSVRDENSMISRYGGEEFLCVFVNCPRELLREKADEIIAAIRNLKEPHASSPISDFVSVSMGGATMVPQQDNVYGSLISKADEALYKAKESGRNQFIQIS